MENIIELKKKINSLKDELFKLEEELADKQNYILMYCFKKGKHNFVMQPIEQLNNLKSNNWREFSKEEMIEFLGNYDF
jgi:hypothetical protein